MPDNKEHTEKAATNHPKPDPIPDWVFNTGFVVLLCCAGALVVVVFIFAYYTKDEAARTNVVIVGVFGALSFVTSCIAAFLNGRMAIIMERQEVEIELQRKAAEAQAETSGKQWQSMEDALVEAQKTLEQSERHFRSINRPVLGIESIEWDSQRPRAGMDAGRFWRVIVKLQNFGNTPAYEVMTDATLNVIPYVAENEPCPEPIKTPHHVKRSKGVIAAKALVQISPQTPPLTSENFVNL